MNIVYLITNTTKTEGRRYYIGSKAECQILDVDGVPTIIDRDGKPYYSSSSSYEFRTDAFSGHVLSASILEDVPDKMKLLETENKWIERANAVLSEEYYNMSNAVLDCYTQDNVANLYGETVRELAKNNSAASKRDNNAKDLGFSNFGELCFDVWGRYCQSGCWKNVSDYFGKDRHWSAVLLKHYDMEKAKNDLARVSQDDVRKLVSKKCSLQKVCEILDIEMPAARVLLGDFGKSKQKAFGVAMLQGKSQGEMEAAITKDVLNGMGWVDVVKKYATSESSAKRYFMRCIRRHISPEDISDKILETPEELEQARHNRKAKQQRMAGFMDSVREIKESPLAVIVKEDNQFKATGVNSRQDTNGKKWVAMWIDENGKERRKGFSVFKLGEEGAFKTACEYREKMINEVAKLKEPQ